MRNGGFGFAGVATLVVVGVVVTGLTGVAPALAGVPVGARLFDPEGALPMEVPVPEAGVEVAGVGNDVSGVGSGGSGLARMPAIISLSPASDWL